MADETNDQGAASPSEPEFQFVPTFPVLPEHYANSVFCHMNKQELTIMFLRVPIAPPESLLASAVDGKIAVPVVTSVTLPVAAAAELVKTILSLYQKLNGDQ